VDRLDRTGQARALGRGVANVGLRPTVAKSPETPSVEVHLLEFAPDDEQDRDLYGAELRLHLVEFLRGEQKFPGLEALRAQIATDAERARNVLRGKKPAPGPFAGWY
jgi:riboflavin kinase/FMN adenylyltransferase